MHVAVASVKCGLKRKPSASKNEMERCRSVTGRLTNSLCRVAGVVPAFVIVGPGAWVVDMARAPEVRREGIGAWESASGAQQRPHAVVAQVQPAPDEGG